MDRSVDGQERGWTGRHVFVGALRFVCAFVRLGESETAGVIFSFSASPNVHRRNEVTVAREYRETDAPVRSIAGPGTFNVTATCICMDAHPTI
jgi:hypothetical protein